MQYAMYPSVAILQVEDNIELAWHPKNVPSTIIITIIIITVYIYTLKYNSKIIRQVRLSGVLF